ncbi:hypothetical protein FB451DRAFT_1566078 [Mycena latifolia]|nr:hypothetical protein FB451DRAFT_1566078 [Mycena latifolia]
MSLSLVPAITARPRKQKLEELKYTDTVDIFHPRARGEPILQFMAYPSQPGGGVVGVPLGIVLDACFVVAENQRGQLILLDSDELVADNDSNQDALLSPGVYRFVVVQPEGGLDFNYQLCESFSSWKPPVLLPDRWKGSEATEAPRPSGLSTLSNVSAAVKSADRACIMTGATTGLQASNMVPQSEADWYKQHYLMFKSYGGVPSEELNSAHNQVALRTDLCLQGLDQGHFLFAPYADRVVAVFVKSTGQDLAQEYHLREVNFPTRIRRGYLFARFAWNIFRFSSPGLSDAAAQLGPQPASSKRKTDKEAGSQAEKSKMDAGGSRMGSVGGERDIGGSGGGRNAGGGGSGGGMDAGNEESAPQTEDETMLAIYEAQDSALKSQLTIDDLQAGRYHGFSKSKRIESEYRRDHPEVSAVRNARNMRV